MKLRISAYFILSSAVIGLIISSCNNFVAPPPIWNPNQQYAAGAVISGVTPSNSAIAGVRLITIIGKNFSKVIDSNWVWFGTQQAIIKSVSAVAGASADTLVAYRPPNSGPLTLKEVILGADSISGTIPYNLESPVSTSDISSIAGLYLVMEAGKNDTMWIASKGYIYELSPDGTSIVTFKDTSYLQPKINKKATDFSNNFIDLKFGPGGFLYATFNSSSSSNTIYQINPDTTVPKTYAIISQTKSVGYFDFDDNGNIYTGNSKGLYLIKPDRTSMSVGDYSSGFIFGEIRVIKDPGGAKFVYVGNSTGLYKSQINSDGTLGGRQQIVNILTDTNFTSNNKLSSFNVASDGTVLVSVIGGSTYSLYVLENGSLTPYYHDNILPTGIDQLIWGNDRYLYLSRGKTGSPTATRFYKMGVAQNDNTALYGTYLGRGL